MMLDVKRVAVAVVGNSPAAARRVVLLDAAGARDLTIYAPDPGAEMAAVCEGRRVARLPNPNEIARARVIFTADLPDGDAEAIARLARAARTLVNTEDVKPLCDFHVPSMVRRGDLLLTISTGGKSPGLARRLRKEFETRFGPEWAGRLDQLADVRAAWRAEGLSLPEVSQRTDAFLTEKGWV